MNGRASEEAKSAILLMFHPKKSPIIMMKTKNKTAVEKMADISSLESVIVLLSGFWLIGVIT